MRPTAPLSTAQSGSLAGQRQTMTIAQDALGAIMQVLTQMYPQPILATARETITNADDEHRRAGVTDKVEVDLPTAARPTLVVRDRGRGMTSEILLGNFGAYGSSTKRGDDVETGMLGIGAKAPLAYTSTFTVDTVSEADGRIVAEVGVDGDGLPYVEVLLHEPEFDTGQTGTTITVPVAAEDVGQFRETVSSLAEQYEPQRLLVDGEYVATIWEDDHETAIALGDDVALIPDSRDQIRAVQGGDVYVVNPYHRYPSRWSLVVRLPIGTLTPAPSRETVIDGPSKRAFEAAVEAFVGDYRRAEAKSELARRALRLIEDAESLQRAAHISEQVFGAGRDVVWRGIKFPVYGNYAGTATRKARTVAAYRIGATGRDARAHLFSLSDTRSVLVVTETALGSSSVGVAHRRRAQVVRDQRGLDAETVLFVRGKAADLPFWLKERASVITFEDLKKIPDPQAPTRRSARTSGSNRPRRSTPVRVFGAVGGSGRTVEEDDITGDVFVVSPTDETLISGEVGRRAPSTAVWTTLSALGVTLVTMRGNSIARFEREYEDGDVLDAETLIDLAATLAEDHAASSQRLFGAAKGRGARIDADLSLLADPALRDLLGTREGSAETPETIFESCRHAGSTVVALAQHLADARGLPDNALASWAAEDTPGADLRAFVTRAREASERVAAVDSSVREATAEANEREREAIRALDLPMLHFVVQNNTGGWWDHWERTDRHPINVDDALWQDVAAACNARYNS